MLHWLTTLTNMVLVRCIYKNPSSRAVVSAAGFWWSRTVAPNPRNMFQRIWFWSIYILAPRLHLSACGCGARLSESFCRKSVDEPQRESQSPPRSHSFQRRQGATSPALWPNNKKKIIFKSSGGYWDGAWNCHWDGLTWSGACLGEGSVERVWFNWFCSV